MNFIEILNKMSSIFCSQQLSYLRSMLKIPQCSEESLIGRLSYVLQRWFKITFKFELISGSFLFDVQLSNADLTGRHNSSHWKIFDVSSLEKQLHSCFHAECLYAHLKGPIGVEIIFLIIRRTLQLQRYRDSF